MSRANLAHQSEATGPRPVRPSRPSPRPTEGPSREPKRAGTRLAPAFLTIAVLLIGTFLGRAYYFAPLGERVRSPLHAWLKPSGYIGQTAGILAIAIFVFLWLYPLRKKYRWLAWTGAMSRWLDVHVSLALLLPVLAAVHASWKFDGVIGLGFWSMMVVWLSGIVGRYLYVHIPRSATGLELTAEEIGQERKELIGRVAAASGLPIAQVEGVLRSDPLPIARAGFMKTLALMVRDDLGRRRAARGLRRICASLPPERRPRPAALREIVRMASREMALTQQARMLESSRRIFQYWHVAHRPFAMAALAAVLVHVGVVVAMGATWFW